MKKLALASIGIVWSVTHSGSGVAANYHVYQWHHAMDESRKQDCGYPNGATAAPCCNNEQVCHCTAGKGTFCAHHTPKPRYYRG
jgi:hypothetical protein